MYRMKERAAPSRRPGSAWVVEAAHGKERTGAARMKADRGALTRGQAGGRACEGGLWRRTRVEGGGAGAEGGRA